MYLSYRKVKNDEGGGDPSGFFKYPVILHLSIVSTIYCYHSFPQILLHSSISNRYKLSFYLIYKLNC